MPSAVRRPKSAPSLVEFVRERRRDGCAICALPADIREQLAQARTKKVPREVQVAWLAACGHAVSNAALDTHRNGRHDFE